MRLSQISPSDRLSQLAIEVFLQNAPIALDLEWFSTKGNSGSLQDSREGESADPWRSVNQSTSGTKPTITETPKTKMILAYEAIYDIIYKQRGFDVGQVLETQLKLETLKKARFFQKTIFTGDNAANSKHPDGFANLDGASQTITPTDPGIFLPGNSDSVIAANQEAFMYLLELLEAIPFPLVHLYVPNVMTNWMIAVGKRLGFYEDYKTPEQELPKIGKAILRGCGYDESGNSILDFNEELGAHTKTASFYAVVHGEEVNVSAQTSQGLVITFPGVNGNFESANANLDCAIHRTDPKALWKLKGFAKEAAGQ